MTDDAIGLSAEDISNFITRGYVRIDAAFPTALADEARTILWAATGCDPDDRTTWTRPVIRLNQFGQPPFRAAANTAVLHRAFDQLVGVGRWQPRMVLGTFPVRFPSAEDPGDTGWHIDTSFALPGDDPADFLGWRANIHSKGRALLMLFLFSDVGDADAPTRLRVGSHIDIARRLAPGGETGMTLRELAANGFAESAGRAEALATGPAGTVYLCHPFLVHAGQPHHGSVPKFMAQPPLVHARDPSPADLAGSDAPIYQAIRAALA